MSLDDVQVHLVDSVDTAVEMFRWLGTTNGIIGCDTETSGLDKDRDHVRLIQVGDQRTGWAIPLDRWGGVFEELVAKYDGFYAMHNAPYDHTMLKRAGIVLPRMKIHDTRPMIHVLESTGSLALKNYAKKNIDPRAAQLQDELDAALRKGGWTWATVPTNFGPYWQYGGLDPILTMQAFDQLYPRVQAEAPISYQLEIAVAWSCEKMERRGVRVDRPYVGAMIDELEVYISQVDEWCRVNFAIANPGSDAQVRRALLDVGCDLIKKTASGAAYSVDKEVLAGLDHPLAGAILGRRQAVKVVSTYLGNYLAMTDHDDFIHPSINTVGGTDKNPFEPGGGGKGVRTGRMSMSDPNLQNVPIRTAMGKRIRNAFIPREEHAWIKCDADQIEMRILAHLANEPKMIEAFKSEGDFFVNLARDLFNEPDFQKADPRRQFVKNGGYAKIYGAGPDKFAKTAGAPLAEASAFMTRFDNMYPSIPLFVREIENLARRRFNDEGEAYVRSPMTNRKHVADRGREYALLNYLIQGTAGEVLKMKIVEADAAGLDEFMLFPVHDEIDLDVPFEQVNDVVTTLRDVMNDDQMLTVPITWTSAVGARWGDAKDVA
jgi:DNA polymerase-1